MCSDAKSERNLFYKNHLNYISLILIPFNNSITKCVFYIQYKDEHVSHRTEEILCMTTYVMNVKFVRKSSSLIISYITITIMFMFKYTDKTQKKTFYFPSLALIVSAMPRLIYLSGATIYYYTVKCKLHSVCFWKF